ncbi:hypothetical protein EDB89DRAFT_2115148 [Lactarius sanguifluus]|nr:hypothetical protein EDB89DRAFT_2115148 [Lactarius sanguifluus]
MATLSICTDVPQDELWENVNPGLDRILGFRRPQEEIVMMVHCSQVGLQGLYEYLEVLVEEGGIVGGLLEGKVTALLMAMESGILHHISNSIHTNTVYAYQPIGGLIEILWKKCAMLDGLRFKQLSILRTLATRARTVGQYEQLIMAMSEGTVNRMDGVGVRGMMELLDCNFTEEERSCGLLFLRLGGARVASLAHQTLGVPTLSTLHYGSSTVTSLSPSAGFPTRSEIQGNIQAAFKNSSGSGVCGYVLMIDEIKVEERMRWDPSTDKILGLCQEHTEHVGLDFCSMSDAKALVHGILHGELHHTSEATVFSIRVLSGNRHTLGSWPFIITGTCKWEDTDRHARLISTVVEACNAESSTIGCPLFCVASDGESCQGSALTTLTHKRLLDPNSELHVLLGKLRLMNLLVGNNDITTDKDPKHVMKRCQNFTIRKSGVMINSFIVTPALLRFYFQANNVPPHHISYLLNPADCQDVPLCYTFMKEVWSLPPPALTDKPSFVAARDALLMLRSLFQHLVLPFVQVSLSLHEQLVHLSAAAHLAMFLFTAKGARSKAMPSLTFKDLVLLVKNMYFCVAKVKIYTPDGDFYLILNGTDWLESTFGVCLNIFSEHPAWDHGPRHLHLCGIEDRNGDVLSKSDHITPASWKGNINVCNVSLITAWNLGCQMAVSDFPSSNIEDALLELESQGHDMEFPFGQVAEGLEEPEDGNGEGEGPLLDLEDHASIETSHDGRGKFSPLINIRDVNE